MVKLDLDASHATASTIGDGGYRRHGHCCNKARRVDSLPGCEMKICSRHRAADIGDIDNQTIQTIQTARVVCIVRKRGCLAWQ